MGSANCTLIGQTYRGTASSAYSATGSTYAGKSSSKYYDHRLKFETPTFTGVPKTLTFNFSASSGNYNFVVLHYALCTSDANVSMYQNHHNYVTNDPYQIASGTVRCENLKTNNAQHSITINASDISQTLSPSTTYYLIMWSYQNASEGIYAAYATINPITGQTAILTYDGGLLYIDEGTGIGSYQAYIDNGTSLDLYLPYRDNGTGWDQCL